MFKKTKNLLRTSGSIYGLRALNYVNEMWRNDWQNDALSGWKFVLFSKWREGNRIFTRRSKPESRSKSLFRLLLHGTMCRTTDGVMLKLWTKVFKPALNWAPADWKIPKIVASRRFALYCCSLQKFAYKTQMKTLSQTTTRSSWEKFNSAHRWVSAPAGRHSHKFLLLFFFSTLWCYLLSDIWFFSKG